MKKRIAMVMLIVISIFSIININSTEVYADFEDVELDDFDTD